MRRWAHGTPTLAGGPADPSAASTTPPGPAMQTAPRHRRPLAIAALALVGLTAAACDFDRSSAAEQRQECRRAAIGETTRDAVHARLGGPTTTQHETIGGVRRVVDIYLDGHVGFGFERGTGRLIEKDCAGGEL
jgi:hypothetical protein